MSSYAFDAYVTAALFDKAGRALFALGDGTVRFEDGTSVRAHEGAVLAACLHPSGEGLITGGDDGRVVWSTPQGATELARVPGRWIEQVAASAQSISERIADVAAVAEESSASTEQVSASTQQTSASTQEIAASAQELASTASELERLVGRSRVAA